MNSATFAQFSAGLEQLASQAAPTDQSPEERVANAKRVFLRKIDKKMAIDLESCVHCGHCAWACHFQVSTGNPKYTPIRKLDLLRRFYQRELSPMRLFNRLWTRDISADELADWQELVFDSCTECGRCSQVCPMGINIAAGVNVMREGLAEAGLIPDELRAVEQEQCANASVFGVGTPELRQAVEQMRESGLDVPLDKDQADVLVLSSVVDIVLFNEALSGTVKIMNHLGVDWTLRSCGYEAANFGLLSGYEKLQKAASERVIDEAIAIGAKTVIVPECGHAYPALRWEGANQIGRELPFEVLAVSEYIGREIQAGRLRVNPIGKGKKVTFHDPCKQARHGGVIEEPRTALKALNVDFRETESHGELNWCCGGGAGVFLLNRAAPLREKAFGIKIRQVNDTGADSVVMTCGSCRLNFLNGKENTGWDKDVESLVELVAANLAD